MSRYSIVKSLSLAARLGILALSFLIWSPCNGETELEETFEAASEVKESSELFERLEELKANPLDLNRATYKELIEIPWITPTMAKRIVEYREKGGLFRDPRELSYVKGFSAPAIEKILPYVVLGKPTIPIARHYQFRSRAADEYPREDLYLGSSRRIYNRAIADIGDRVSVCALAEKDPYEERFLDFFTFSARVKDLGPLTSLAFGDYSLDFGEGLVFSPSRFIIKGSGITKGSERGIVPNRSTVEAGLLRGVATRFDLGDLSIYGFVSDARLDASIDDDGLVRSIYDEGLHRTVNEVEKINKLRETLLGGRTQFSAEQLRLGVSGYSGVYEPAVAERNTTYYTFSGEMFRVLGVDLEVGIGAAEFFGEYAKSVSLGQGYVVGLSYKEKMVNAGLLFRHYDEDFYSPHSAGFSDSDDENEEGGYLEMGYKLGKQTKLSGYIDLFRKLGPSYGSVYSSGGRDLRLQIEHKAHRKLRFKGRIYMKGREESAHGEEAYFRERRGFRIQAEFKASSKATLIARFEAVRAHLEEESAVDAGSLLYWEVNFKPIGTTSLKGRLSVFDTDSWDARLYQYESDLPGVMRNVVVNGAGAMGYCLAGFKPIYWLKVTGKLSWKKKDGEEEWNVAGQTDIDFQMARQ